MFSYDSELGDIYLFDEIGPEWAGMIGASAVVESLHAMAGKDVQLYLSTPGGSVDEGTSIYNAITRYAGKVTIYVDSIAASMGSYILQAADERIVSENSKLMIHEPWGVSMGNADELRKEADVLDKYSEGMLPAYAQRSGKSPEEVKAIMSAETWYVGQEIVDAGFADKIQGTAKQRIDQKALARWARKIPQALVVEEQSAEPAEKFYPARAAALAKKIISEV